MLKNQIPCQCAAFSADPNDWCQPPVDMNLPGAIPPYFCKKVLDEMNSYPLDSLNDPILVFWKDAQLKAAHDRLQSAFQGDPQTCPFGPAVAPYIAMLTLRAREEEQHREAELGQQVLERVFHSRKRGPPEDSDSNFEPELEVEAQFSDED